ncbi:crossover junction endonuclease MUS81 [Anthonomus grandis grandis]|uniref:crossover junction endonuclease MUS81 n=1 Tax=Anthonomus grandis grandis TaxID=2921223 RepID=UPI0021650B80|nr:crossover junction endonuclease MUS81 [Anthonomus grandis grandis]
MMNSKQKTRITGKLKCPNPLFEQWLISWRDQAMAKESKMQHTFNRALKSLRLYPIPLESGKECKILKGFGDTLCRMLDDKLKEYRAHNGGEIESQRSKGGNNKDTDRVITDTVGTKPRGNAREVTDEVNKPGGSKQYVPQYGSGGYAILITLYTESLKPDYPGYLKKSDIVLLGTPYLDNSSFTKPDPGSRYNAWSSMRTLLSKELVLKKSNPAKFSLTKKGWDLAKKLYEKSQVELPDNVSETDEDPVDLNQDCLDEIFFERTALPRVESCPEQPQTAKTPLQKFATVASCSGKGCKRTFEESCRAFSMSPYSFDVILYVDTSETSGFSNSHKDELLQRLIEHGVQFEVKKLKVSDFVWVSRDRGSNEELVLPYAVERKRMDDFASSIKDKRYYEQKFRLKKSGIENLIYLVESHGNNQHVGLPLKNLHQAASNTAIQENFFVKFTENTKETVEYLANMFGTLKRIFASKTLCSCPKDTYRPVDLNRDSIDLITFKEFQDISIKNKRVQHVSDLFVKMLVQIKGLSVDKALAVVRVYPTPRSLKTRYENSPPGEGERMLAGIKCGNKCLGVALSKTVYRVFQDAQY